MLKNKYNFCGLELELDVDLELISVSYHNTLFVINTTTKIFDMKACFKCNRIMSLDKFYEKKSPCKKCHIATVRTWKDKHPDLKRKHERKYILKAKKKKLRKQIKDKIDANRVSGDANI